MNEPGADWTMTPAEFDLRGMRRRRARRAPRQRMSASAIVTTAAAIALYGFVIIEMVWGVMR